MAVPTDITDISSTESSNSPSGSESVGVNLDNYLRAAYAITKQQAIKGSDIASGSTITIPTIGAYFVVTGTTTIGAINDSFNGRISVLKFSGALTLTNSAGLILFGADITTAAGDVLTVVNESAGVYRAISFSQAASGYTTLTGTETLTNKTIVAANNTITTAASGNLVATELDAALAELEAEITANVAAIALRATIANVLELDNTDVFVPDADYEPATKKYADDLFANTSGIVQVAYAELTTSGTGATVIPRDGTIPQITEGNEVLTCAITPNNAGNDLLVTFSTYISEVTNTGNYQVACMFRDSTADAIISAPSGGATTQAGVVGGGLLNRTFKVAANSTNETTFKLRAGNDVGSIRWNGSEAAQYYGASCTTTITIMEIVV